MRLTILAVGRAKGRPEAALVDEYLKRLDGVGRPLGLGPCRLLEIDDRKAQGPEAQGAALLSAAPDGPMVALDERGETLDSFAFANRLASLRDGGARDLAFAIGGADGHGEALRAHASAALAFGPMTWPHMLARAMLAEQLYRAASILAGAPYHRG